MLCNIPVDCLEKWVCLRRYLVDAAIKLKYHLLTDALLIRDLLSLAVHSSYSTDKSRDWQVPAVKYMYYVTQSLTSLVFVIYSYREGRLGSPWRHIKACINNAGNHLVFIDGESVWHFAAMQSLLSSCKELLLWRSSVLFRTPQRSEKGTFWWDQYLVTWKSTALMARMTLLVKNAGTTDLIDYEWITLCHFYTA